MKKIPLFFCIYLLGYIYCYGQPKGPPRTPKYIARTRFNLQAQQAISRAIHRQELARMQHTRHPISRLLTRETPRASTQPRFKYNARLGQDYHSLASRYHEVLNKFETLKSQVNSTLYYQSLSHEAQELTPFEKSRWTVQMIPLYSEVTKLLDCNPKDAALNYASKYLHFGILLLDPSLEHIIAPYIKEKFAAKEPVKTNFFLYRQEGEPLPAPSVDLDGKNIAILNDDATRIEFFEKYFDFGLLVPSAHLYTQTNPEVFLAWMKSAPVKLDILFTDLNLGQSSGFSIARQLRQNGFKGKIIALTAEYETPQNAQQLQQAGFDGMVYIDGPDMITRLTYAAQIVLRQKEPNLAK